MKGWVVLVGWPVTDGLPTLLVSHQLQVERRTGKVRQSETDVLPLCHATRYRLLQSYTHTHPFNSPFSGTTRVSRYQKRKTSLDYTEARDREWQWHKLHLAPDRWPCQHPTAQFFTGRMPFLSPNLQRQSTEGKIIERLLQSCCTSLCGCELWCLSDEVQGLCTAWRKSIRKIWELPYRTHCYLLPLLCRSLPSIWPVMRTFT